MILRCSITTELIREFGGNRSRKPGRSTPRSNLESIGNLNTGDARSIGVVVEKSGRTYLDEESENENRTDLRRMHRGRSGLRAVRSGS